MHMTIMLFACKNCSLTTVIHMVSWPTTYAAPSSYGVANTWLQSHACNHMCAITCLPHLIAGSSVKAPQLASGSYKGFVSMHIKFNVLLKPSMTHLA